ncbi:MAG: phosphomethylpyrimidine synthase ThiC, partial [Candidatus Omnitrophica bacterium]|nr:phosphomethylpyrimidine synthase ThiC [Candidatus Omnitrophota bacterium]
MTQLELAKSGVVTPIIRIISGIENIKEGELLKKIASGKAVIPLNRSHKIKKPCAIGSGLRTKVNANIGTSTDIAVISEELKKLAYAVRYGADTVMDLSVGDDLEKTRCEILKTSPIPVGTVPIYEVAVKAQKRQGDFLRFDQDDCLEVLESQAKEGVDFFTIHAGITKESLKVLRKNKRLLGIVSRGGAIMAHWISDNNKENPFFAHFDRVLDICHEYDVTLSLGDGLRPGTILDSTDKAQLSELSILGRLVAQSRKRGVQVMVEGPGHVPLHQIKENIELEKKYCHQAPFYVLGPLVCDVGAGYDHITSAIGGALAASYGADFLCYVTPSEHLRHPTLDDVREGVIASRIAAHAGDITKGVKGAIDWDKDISLARKKRDWKKQISLSIDPDKARYYRNSSRPKLLDVCTMCGKYCSIKLMEGCLK